MRFFLVIFLLLTGQACGGEVQKDVEKFVSNLYQRVEKLKRSRFRQYLFYGETVSEIKKPPPVKRPDYEALQERYLRKYLKLHGEGK